MAMKIAVTARLRELAAEYLENISLDVALSIEKDSLKENHKNSSVAEEITTSEPSSPSSTIQLPPLESSPVSIKKHSERSLLESELKDGFLSTQSYKLLVSYCQSHQLPAIFPNFEGIKIVMNDSINSQTIINSTEKSKEEKAKEKRREYLKMRQEERDYRSMLDTAILPKKEESNANIFNSLKFQLSISFNMISGIIASFGMGYYIASQLQYNSSESMIIGLVAGIAIMILEMVLFITRAVRTEEETENKLLQKKKKTH